MVVDLTVDTEWRRLAEARGLRYLAIPPDDFWRSELGTRVVILDCRGAFEQGLALLRLVRRAHAAIRPVVVTDCELASAHAQAFAAGAERVVWMPQRDPGYETVLAEAAKLEAG